ncbi:MAG TPA: ABC transporter ATP-binding protein, partial [Syntrophales bacterium]|nr:ABC transporter ATP-binding protein [Syntrophales bacterium]
HDINHAALYSRRVLALKEGRISFDGSPKDIMNNEKLKEIYEKTFTFIEHPKSGIPIIIPEVE